MRRAVAKIAMIAAGGALAVAAAQVGGGGDQAGGQTVIGPTIVGPPIVAPPSCQPAQRRDLAFEDGDIHSRIRTRRANGSGRAVVRKGDFGYGLAISPDGCKLAYVVPGRIITKKTPQGEVARTTKSALVIAAADGSGKPERVFRAYYIDHADLAWSPSGDRIAIAAEESLRVYDATTGATQAVGLGETYYVGSPTWAPDGTEIAFAGDPLNGAKSQDVRPDIYVIPATGGVAQPLAVTPQYSESSLSWSPDGRSIAFVDLNAPTEDIHGTHEAYRRGVFLYSVQTNTLTRLAKRTGLHPTWLPDSSAVVYAKNLGYTSGNAGEPVRKIVAVSLAGEAARTILGPRATLRDPDWAREGSLPAP